MTGPRAATGDWELAFGANVVAEGVRFRVWAPKARWVEVELVDEGRAQAWWPLESQAEGTHVGTVTGLRAGARYRYRLDGEASFPDPWSRFQPEGVHGPSAVVDPRAFRWTDAAWRGIERDRLVFYELHVGTFTPEGTFAAIIPHLPRLRRLGVTALELMPVAEFPGRWGWGYDGVDLFAPKHEYGGPDGLKRLVDRAHAAGLGVFLDVVYNHFGPDGNYLGKYSDTYVSSRHKTDWGDALNFDGPGSPRVRELVIQNACYWLREYHLDGLRLDATHAIVDDSPKHVLAELVETARRVVGPGRRVYFVSEDNRNEIALIRPPEQGGLGLDAVWADDFHHAVHVALTGEQDRYYADYTGTAAEIARTISTGFLYQGQHSRDFGRGRGTPVGDEPGSSFVFCLQNHDQVGNRPFGERLSRLVDPDRLAVATVLLLLAPEIPLLFMGQEFAASSPFLYFTDHEPELGRLVTAGFRASFARFTALQEPGRLELIPDPQDPATFQRCRIDHGERTQRPGVERLHRDLLRLRQADPVFRQTDRRCVDAEAVGDRCVVLRRWAAPTGPEIGARRIVVANLGEPVRPSQPDLLAWLATGTWRVVLSTAAKRYAGHGRRPSWRRVGGIRSIVVPEATTLVLADAGSRAGG